MKAELQSAFEAVREVNAQEIVDDLEAALEQFRLIAEDLRPTG